MLICDRAESLCSEISDFIELDEETKRFIKMSKHIGTHQITFAKCDGSANTDSDCLSTPYSKHYSVAVYAVLDDLKKTNNLQSPYIFELTLGPKGCDTNSIVRMIPRMPFANIYSLKSKEIERFGYQPVHT